MFVENLKQLQILTIGNYYYCVNYTIYIGLF